jgi:hypothetical protein
MLSILAADILHLICVELRLSSLPDLCSFALANHAVSSIARVHIFYTLALRVTNPNTKNRLEMLQANSEWCTFIREIQITGEAGYRDTESHVWALIEVGRARGELRPMRIEWDAHTIVKADLQQALVDTFPSAALFVHLHAYKGDPIPYSPHLISLHAVVHLHTDALWHFKPALLNAPNLRHLKIQQYQSRGCVIRVQPPPPFLQSSTFRESADDSRSLPLLEELEIKYFDFRQDVHFMQRLNWSKLSSLKIDYCGNSIGLLQNLAPQFSSSFPNLRQFRITEGSWYWRDKSGELNDLLLALGQILEAFDPGFEELVFVGPFTSLMDVIGVSQGRSLRWLKMHDIESADAKMERKIATTRELENMGNRCKDLEHLYLDVNSIHSGSGTDVSLRDLHSLLMHTSSSSSPMFPHLKVLTISVPLGIATETAPSVEQIAEAKAMCSELLVGRPEYKRMLKSIRLEIGEQGREIGGGRPAPWVLWERGTAHAWAFEKEGDSDAVSEIGPVRGRPSLI